MHLQRIDGDAITYADSRWGCFSGAVPVHVWLKSPQTETDYRGYQLVRNILCAAAHGYVFTLVCDARRPDLIRDWWSVGRAVRDAELRARLRLVLWQELAAESPEPLGNFLNSKYVL